MSDLENMYPYELEIYTALIQKWIQEQEQKQANQYTADQLPPGFHPLTDSL